MKLGRRINFLFSAAFLASLPLAAQDFPKAMKKVFTGTQYRNYQWAPYPMDDYGVGTAYRGTESVAQPGSFLCATYTCFRMAKPDIATAPGLASWLVLSPAPAPGGPPNTASTEGYADSGCGTNVDSSLQANSKWAVTAIVPQLMGVLGINANLSNDRNSTTTLAFGKACNRKLLQVKAINYLTKSTDDPYGVRAAYDNKRLTLVLEDIVITSFDFKITAKGDLKAGLDAKLANDPTGKFGNNSSLAFTLEKSGTNDYHLKSSTPLIVGFLAKSNHDAPIGAGAGPGLIAPWYLWKETTVALPPK
jgi:hypothetical protein